MAFSMTSPKKWGGAMEPNGQRVNWREVAFLLNGANEVLVEKIDKLNQKYSSLQCQCKKKLEPEQLTESFK